jgi:hypothetical protein
VLGLTLEIAITVKAGSANKPVKYTRSLIPSSDILLLLFLIYFPVFYQINALNDKITTWRQKDSQTKK